MIESIMFGENVVDRDSIIIESGEVVDARFKNGDDLTDKQIRLLNEMHQIEELI